MHSRLPREKTVHAPLMGKTLKQALPYVNQAFDKTSGVVIEFHSHPSYETDDI